MAIQILQRYRTRFQDDLGRELPDAIVHRVPSVTRRGHFRRTAGALDADLFLCIERVVDPPFFEYEAISVQAAVVLDLKSEVSLAALRFVPNVFRSSKIWDTS